MLRKKALSLRMLPLLVLLLAVAAFGQNTASIKGTVTDPSGAAIVNAKITAAGPLGIERTAQTNAGGDYEIPALPPGIYSVEVQMSGFQTQQAKNVVLEVSNNAVQNFSLKVAAASEVVTVEATAPVIETTTMTVGQTINQRTVQDIPLNGRHFVDLALLVPGTVVPPQNGFLTAPLRGQGSFAYNTAGNREDAINFMINGINLNDMLQNQVTFQPTINTVSEFKIDNSTYSAEYGRNAGSIVNIATRSGTDQYHGEAYEYLRNNYFDARNAFDRKFTSSGTPLPMPGFKRNQFGGDFGGPIHKGTTFFFLSYEGLRQRQSLTLSSQVFGDTSTVADPISRTSIQAAGKPVANALLGLIPHANGTLNGHPAFLGSTVAPVDIDQGTADLNHKFSEVDQLHGYYVYQRDLRGETGATGGTDLPGFGDTRSGHRQVLTLSETHVFTSSVVNEARLGANRIHITFTPNTAVTAASLGLATALGPNETLMPTISIVPLGALFGAEGGFPQGRGDTTFVLGDTLSWVRGRHSFKFGAEGRDFRNDNFNGDPGTLTYNTLTNFQNDTVDSANRTVGNVANRINQAALDFFAMDSWKFSSSLTFELGVRYAWNMTPSEALNRFATLVPLAGTGSLLVPANQPYAQNNKNFQPRVGFAWNLFRNGNTVLRGGYAFQVDQPITGFVTGLSSNPPFALPITVQSSPISGLSPAFNGTPSVVSPSLIDPNFKNADVQSWNLNLQQQVTHSLGLMVGYFGSKGTHLEIERDINQFGVLSSPLVGPLRLNPTRPFTNVSATSSILPGVNLGNTLTERLSGANSNYNALWVTANKRMSHGLQFNASYTWSHSIDEASRNNNGVIVQDNTNIFASRGPSDFDARQRFVVNAIYDLPFKGNRLVSGWSFAPIVSLQSGNPFNVVIASNAYTGVSNTIHPNANGPVVLTGSALTNWFANPTTVYTTPPAGTLGNLGRNSVVGPDFKDVDFSLIKNTKITERLNAQFRADTFDVFNHPNYGQPGRVFGTSAFGVISSTRFPTSDSGSSRQLQFAMKLIF